MLHVNYLEPDYNCQLKNLWIIPITHLRLLSVLWELSNDSPYSSVAAGDRLFFGDVIYHFYERTLNWA